MKQVQKAFRRKRYRAKDSALQGLRKRRGWTQREMLDELGNFGLWIDKRTYRRWEQGETALSAQRVEIFKKIFGCTLEELGFQEEREGKAVSELEIETATSRISIQPEDCANGRHNVVSSLISAFSSGEQIPMPPLAPGSLLRTIVLQIREKDLLELLQTYGYTNESSVEGKKAEAVFALLYPVSQPTPHNIGFTEVERYAQECTCSSSFLADVRCSICQKRRGTEDKRQERGH